MHESVMTWVQAKKVEYGLDGPLHTLEVGSFDVNGSARGLFDQTNYTGIDIADGPGVDMVLSSHELNGHFLVDSFDLVVSTEALEHDSNPWLTVGQVWDVLKPGGLYIVTARGNSFGEHNPPDYYRFLPAGMQVLLEQAGFQVLEVSEDPQVSGVFAVGRK